MYRVAIVVSRKVSKSAVVRNRIRRRLYEIVREHGHIANSVDLVFTVYKEDVAKMSHASLQKLVLGQLEQASVLRKGPAPDTDHGIVNEKETNI